MKSVSIRILLLLAGSCLGALSYASKEVEHNHINLVRTAGLELPVVLERAVIHAPEYLADSARQHQAASWRKLGRSLVQGNPRISVNYIDDGFNHDLGATEIEAGLEWQLWSWGARGDTGEYAENLGREYSAWQQYLRLAVAGKLRAALADVSLSELRVEQETQALNQARQLVTIARQRFDAGDVAMDAVLQAESLSLNARDRLLEAQARQVDAARQYQFLTGTNQLPSGWQEQQSNQTEIGQHHPLLMLLASEVDIAGSRVNLARHEATGSPSLYLGMRRERPDQMNQYEDSLSLGISYPLGGGQLVSAQVSDAFRVKTDAQIAHERAWRELRQQLHEVEHELVITVERLETLGEQQAIAERRAAMARTAFEVGEVTMNQTVQALQQAREITARHQELVAYKQRLISMFNQTLGLLP